NSSYDKQINGGVNTSISGNGNVGTSSVNYSNSSHYDEGKTLATLGQGNISTEDDSDLTRLNREIDNTNLDLYSAERQQGDINATIDTRLVTEQGRDQIAEDLMKSEMITDSIGQIIRSDEQNGLDFFSELSKQSDSYDAVKEAIAQDPALAAALQNPDLTPEQKETMLNGVTQAVMVKLGYEVDGYDNKIIVDENSIHEGFYSKETGDAYLNDAYIDGTDELMTAAGHELSHALDNQDDIDIDNGEAYADHYGDNLTSYTDQALDISGYDDGMADTNNHVGNDSQTVIDNTTEYQGLDNSKGDSYLTPEQRRQYNQALIDCEGDGRCEIYVARAFTSLRDKQEVDRRLAEIRQIFGNVKEGVSATVDAVTSPIETGKAVIDTVSNASAENIVNGLNQMADDQHQTLVDREEAYLSGDSEALGRAEGDIATENLSALSIPGAAGVAKKVAGAVDDAVDAAKVVDIPGAAGATEKLVDAVEDASQVVDDVADASGSGKLKGNGLGDNGSFEAEGDFGALNQPGESVGSSLIPGGGLDVHEVAGGHLLDKHVGQSREYLENRIKTEGIPAASTFDSLTSAERSISEVLKTKSSDIDIFLNSTEKRIVFERVPVSKVTGKVLTQDGDFLTTSRVTVVIVKDATMPNGYRIQTGFPEL
ncbi:MAG: hypothetical protein P8X79_22590, partial [Reinekea sp.]